MSADQFPSHWQLLPLSEAVDALIDYRGKTPRKTNHGVPLVTAKIVKGGTILPATEYIAEEDYDSWMVRGLPKAGDVVVTTEAPLGEVAQLADENVALAQRIVTLRGAEGLLQNDYLRYVMQGAYIQGQLESRATGSTVKGIKQSELRKIKLPIPPEHEQIKIAGHLRALDDRVQLNHQINQTLEQMAQAIFKSWFVDFEPVKAKITALEAGGSEEDALLAAMQVIAGDAQGCANAAGGRMPGAAKGDKLTRLQTEQPEQYAELRATAELFPSAMQDSELGEIPQRWEVLPLGKMINLIGGGTPKKSEPSFWNGDIRWFSVKDVPSDGNVFVVDTEDKITEEGLNRSSTKLLPIGTTIITARGTVGKLALTGVSTAMNQSCYGVTANDETGPYLNYLRLSEAVATLKRNTHGAVFDTITRSTFDTVIQPRSCLALRQRFEQAVTPMFEAIRNNLVQSNTLSEARDSLLPKLLSGELSLDAQPAEKEVVNV